MRKTFRGAVLLALTVALTLLLLQPRGSYGKAGPLTRTELARLLCAAFSLAVLGRAVRGPGWALLLGGLAGGIATGSSLESPQGVILGLVVGAIVASAPWPRAARPRLDA
jgi:hypothetical protein